MPRSNPRIAQRRAPLTVEEILRWADLHHRRTGKWPTRNAGTVFGMPEESWGRIDAALRHGRRGLPDGSSLARLLWQHRGVPNRSARPPLTKKQILDWAEAHHRRTGRWPSLESGPVKHAPGETWHNIDRALRRGDRGLAPGDSLAKFLNRRRGVPHRHRLRRLTIAQILAWADAHYRRYRKWPTNRTGRVVTSPDEDWGRINAALNNGSRGLAGGSSLAKLLAEHRGRQYQPSLPRLTLKKILCWADAHFARTGRWPGEKSGPIADAPAETWSAVADALRSGRRGLLGGSSLAKLLHAERGGDSGSRRPPLTLKQVLAWADDQYARTGKWPTYLSGRVMAAPTETWGGINAALRHKHRGIRRGTTLAKLLEEKRGYRHSGNRSRLTVEQILAWADAHHRRTGQWPDKSSGEIAGAHGETWQGVGRALKRGHRGLAGGSSIAKLLAKHRGYRNPKGLPPLSVSQILEWADGHRRRTGCWPNAKSSAVMDAPDEKWGNIQNALYRGQRGLPKGLTIMQLLAEHRGVRNQGSLPGLKETEIGRWAKEHFRRLGKWPTRTSGEVVGAPGETWEGVHQALRQGRRGLPGGSSLPTPLQPLKQRSLHT